MMTSASTYPAAGFPSTALSDGCGGEDETAASSGDTALSLRLVKRPLAGHALTDTCKKRRKQSTPIRISTSGTTSSDDINGTGTSTTGSEGKLGPFLSSPDLSPAGTPALAPATAAAVDSHFATEHHHQLLLSHVKLEPAANPSECKETDVAAQARGSDSPESPVNLSGGQNFPPWMSDMQSKADDWLGAASLQAVGFAGAAASVYLPGMPHYPPTDMAAPTQPRTPGQPPIRIFNPEAYCELCNKEFCNKYFLKTHKANKHRIYSDPPASEASVPGVPVNVPSFASAVFKKNMSTSSSDIVPPKSADLNKPLGAYPSAFCDICGKGFCNMMFLKTHRASIHGILSESEQSADCGDTDRVINSQEEAAEQENTQADPIAPEEDQPVRQESPSLKNGHATRTDIPTVKEETILEQDEASMSALLPQQRDNIDFSTNRLRRLGIMNPEAFCEICCKEYCNKYFLRTHKMKRHGILIPDDNSKDNQKDFKLELSISNSWYQIQTSPLNLIMGEQNTNSSGSNGDRKSSPAHENECEICGMRFQTVYLAQLHAAAGHPKSGKEASGAPAEPTIKTEDVSVTNNNDKHATSSADSISEDLQKLQTMILQLNDLDVSKVGAACHLCNKELENRYYLHAHMMTEHGVLLEESLEAGEKQNEPEPVSSINELTSCKLCGRDGLTLDALKQHVVECHSGGLGSTSASLPAPDTKDDSNGFVSPDKTSNRLLPAQMPLGAERRASMTLTPTSSYCEICNKELCNKYFMKTHMQRMHGIEIENGAQIGGVVCNICNKELCSKYFLRVHKHNTHGIVEDGAGGGGSASMSHHRQAGEPDGLPTQVPVPAQGPTSVGQQQTGHSDQAGPATDPSLKPADLSDLSHRYFSHFTEVCSICSRRFRSTKWLKAHLLGDHGKAGADKWNELEVQLQQSFGHHSRKPGSIPDRSSPTLRIPNGGQDSNGTPKGGVQNVLSSLFGADESNVKQYHCSFCSFSTPVLAFLFVHERSHARPASGGPDTEATPLQCAVCTQSFRQPDQLHHHIMSQHPFLSLGPFFGGVPQTGQFSSAAPDTVIRNDMHKPDARRETSKSPEQQSADQSEQHRCSKCNQCGRARKQARSGGVGGVGKQTELTADVSSTLKDVSKQSQLPATYALPQRQQQQAKYVMQAFLMDEPTAGAASPPLAGLTGETLQQTPHQQQHQSPAVPQLQQPRRTTSGSGPDRRFAPSIVFLPVLERLTAPLTVSFTLTPA